MSTWEYGSGKAYADPQAAADALFASVGANAFTETHYIRGFAGTYPQESGQDYVVALNASLNPSRQYQMIFDVNDSDEVLFAGIDDTADVGILCNGVSDVAINDIGFSGSLLAAISSGAVVMEVLFVKGCYCGSYYESEIRNAVHPDKVAQLAIDQCKFYTSREVIALEDDAANKTGLIMSLTNSVLYSIVAGYACVQHQTPIISAIIILNSTLRTKDGAVIAFTEANACAIMMVLYNSIYKIDEGTNYIAEFTKAPNIQVSPLGSDYNCFNPYTDDCLALVEGVPFTLDEWRAAMGGVDAHSIESDPLLDIDMSLLPASPCIGTGSIMLAFDVNNYESCKGLMSMGGYQMAQVGYCLPIDIINYAGATKEDLQQDTIGELYTLLNSWIQQATDFIDGHTNDSWATNAAPQVVKNACIRIVSNMVTFAIQRRKSPMIQVAAFDVRLVEDNLISDDIIEMLKDHKKGKAAVYAFSAYNVTEDE